MASVAKCRLRGGSDSFKF